MSGKRRRALYQQCKAQMGTPSNSLFWVDDKGNPVAVGETAVAVAGNVFRAWKHAVRHMGPQPVAPVVKRRTQKVRSGRRRLTHWTTCINCHIRRSFNFVLDVPCYACGFMDVPF